MKFPAAYAVPWHWHTPIERVYMDKGRMEFEMKDGEKVTAGEGSFVLAPSRMAHRAACTGSEDCYFYRSSSGPFDVHVVDDRGM
jgi:quercetin dioxygenase-like cupin family protein